MTSLSKKILKHCIHCGNNVQQDILYEYSNKYYVATCSTCGELALYQSYIYPPSESALYDLEKYAVVWPNSHKLNKEIIPEVICNLYEKAFRIKKISFEGFVVLIRSALEAICFEQGVAKKSLNEGLKELAKTKKLPPLMSEIAAIIRIVGNSGAHYGMPNTEITAAQVQAVDDFFHVIIEYLYIAPQKLEKLQEEMANLKNLKHSIINLNS